MTIDEFEVGSFYKNEKLDITIFIINRKPIRPNSMPFRGEEKYCYDIFDYNIGQTRRDVCLNPEKFIQYA